MARWRVAPARYEAPAWYRTYDPAAWDEPDAEEIAMTAGWTGPWPDYLHDHHARRRWGEAKHAYRKANPGFATQEFEDLRERARKRRLRD